jgi:hypothetical protein
VFSIVAAAAAAAAAADDDDDFGAGLYLYIYHVEKTKSHQAITGTHTLFCSPPV